MKLKYGNNEEIKFGYDISALFNLEEEFGITLDNMWDKVKEEGLIKLVTKLFWAGLLEAKEDITYSEACKICGKVMKNNQVDIEHILYNVVIEQLGRDGFFTKKLTKLVKATQIKSDKESDKKIKEIEKETEGIVVEDSTTN